MQLCAAKVQVQVHGLQIGSAARVCVDGAKVVGPTPLRLFGVTETTLGVATLSSAKLVPALNATTRTRYLFSDTQKPHEHPCLLRNLGLDMSGQELKR
jgi:hypothetical protein